MGNKDNRENGLDKYVDINYLNPEDVEFKRTEGGILSLDMNGQTYERVFLYRSFPFSLEDQYISVRDKKGEEIGIIVSVHDFDHRTCELLKEELDWVYLCPDIRLIHSIRDEFGYYYWDVETDHGRRSFTTKGMDQALVQITENRYLINDLDGSRFQISDLSSLDKKSYRLIRAYV